jgi:propanol-preferring alcohol dehydrogenase
VIGAAGRVGVHLSQLASLRGARVVAADVDSDRLAHVDRRTPEAVVPVDASAEEFAARVREATPHDDGPTVVVDTVGDTDTLDDAWEAMAMGGRVVSLTTHHDRVFGRPMREYVVRETSFVGSRYATKDQVVRAARLLADGRITPVIRRRIDLGEVPAVHRELRRDETFGTTVVEP